MLEMTGSVTLKAVKLKGCQVLTAPFTGLESLDGLEGTWTPSDQEKYPITPLRVKLYTGHWWSIAALEDYLKSLQTT